MTFFKVRAILIHFVIHLWIETIDDDYLCKHDCNVKFINIFYLLEYLTENIACIFSIDLFYEV